MNQDRRKAWGFSLFADDFRVEIGGKTTLVGMYQGDLITQDTFPLVIPRFVVLICYYEMKDALDTDIAFRLTHNTDETIVAEVSIARQDLTNQVLTSPLAEEPKEDDVERIFHLRVPFIMSPFVLPSGGELRVRAHYSDGAVLKLGRLGLRAFTPEQFKEFVEHGGGQLSPAQN